jgi:hypothetical protein
MYALFTNSLFFLQAQSFQMLDRRFLLQLCIRLGSATFLTHFLPLMIEATLLTAERMHETAKESLMWLAKRYGPIVTSTHITIGLLRLLVVCYLEPANQLPEFDEVLFYYFFLNRLSVSVGN